MTSFPGLDRATPQGRSRPAVHRTVTPHLRAIVDELRAVTLPAAQVFWRRRFETIAAEVPVALRASLRAWLCERVRRCHAATKQHRLDLVDLVVRALTPDASATAGA